MIRNHRHETGISGDTLRLFAYLDGEMDVEERTAFESRLSGDGRLASEVGAFQRLFDVLKALEAHAPSHDFKLRVLAHLRARPTLWARAGAWLAAAWTPARQPAPNPLMAHLEGELTPRQSRALAAFLREDPEAARAAREWQALAERLDGIPRLAPSTGFADRVMASLAHAPAPATALALAPSANGLRRRLAALWPRRRERLAALSGVAFGPTAVLAATSYMILSNPLVTPSNLLSYVWAKGAGFMSALGDGFVGSLVENGPLGGAYQFLSGLSLSGSALALGLTAFAALTLLSGWILYRNLIKAPPAMDPHYVAA